MARGNDAATTAATTANQNASSFGSNASNLYSTVAPQLEAEAAAPSGFNPADEAAMQTQAQQTAGGSNAGAVGQGALLAARTRNTGAPAAAIAESARNAAQQLSKNSLGISTANAKLKQQQKQEGLSGLTNLTGLETGAANNALGEVAPNVNANTNAENASWDGVKDLLDPVLSAASYSKGGYSI